VAISSAYRNQETPFIFISFSLLHFLPSYFLIVHFFDQVTSLIISWDIAFLSEQVRNLFQILTEDLEMLVSC